MTRHTWQSWRERYKKNATRLDVKIAQIVDQKKPAHGEKGQYGYVRKPEEKPKRPRKKRSTNGSESVEPVAGPSGVHAMDSFAIPMPVPLPPPLQGLTGTVGGPNDAFNPALYAPQIAVFQHLPAPTPTLDSAPGPAPAAGPANHVSERREEEMEDDEEWQIRESNAPPPAWAKRKVEEEDGPSKKQRLTLVQGLTVFYRIAYTVRTAPRKTCCTPSIKRSAQSLKTIASQ